MTNDYSKTLQELEGIDWGPPTFDSSVVINVHRLRRVPLSHFTLEDMRLLISQQIGVVWLLPRVIETLAHQPLAEGGCFPGDLLCAVLRLPSLWWQERRDWQRAVGSLVEQAITQLDTLSAWERQVIEGELLDGWERVSSA